VKISVDRDVCVAHGQCEYNDPDHFQINDDGELELDENPPEEAREAVLRAVAACPVRALTSDDWTSPAAGTPWSSTLKEE